jgi:tripartite-type tricarboxylate transporter receptor subunit TctC
MKNFRRLLLLGTAALLLAGPACAQDYPNKSIRMIVPFAPGGASDFVGRILVPRLSAVLGQQVFIENKAGAAGNIGMELAAAAAPDGYTVFLGNVGTLAINQSIFGERQKVTQADLEPVTLVANAPDMLVSTAGLPVANVAELVEYARKNAGKMSFASPGSGSLNRLEMELFRSAAQLEMVHVPYKGGAGPALVDVVGGQVPIMFAPIPAVLQLVKAGRLKALAVAGQERLSFLPDVPTMVESGYPQVVGGSWQALLFPVKTPQKIVMQFHAAVTKVLAEEDIRQRLLQGGVEAAVSATPEDLRSFINEEVKRWGAVVKTSSASAD